MDWFNLPRDTRAARIATWHMLLNIGVMVVFFAGVSPDVLKSSGHQWRKTYVEPAAGAAHPAEH